MNRKKIINNLKYAFSAQLISLLLSVLMSLIVPKVLGVIEYGYWQLFIFYSSYVGFFHFGLNDGVYLKFGGTPYEELDKNSITSQFRFGAVFQSIIALLIVALSLIFIREQQRTFVLIATSLYLLFYNMSLYFGFVFQASNETKIYSTSVIIDKITFIFAIALLIILKVADFEAYIVFYVLSKLCSLIYCLYKGRDIVFSTNLGLKSALNESFASIKIGINLMIANIASQSILGIGRFVVDRIWGIESFGKFSFALSLTNFFLLFISQVSMVLFPALRQADSRELKNFYKAARNCLTILLPLIYVFYIPLKILLGKWLPQYQISLEYMALLLPLCNFNGKMNMLCITYFKVLRKERFLLKINVVTMAVSFILSLFGGYVLKSINAIVVIMVIVTGFRSIVSELYLAKLMDSQVVSLILKEIILVFIFMYASWHLSATASFIIISISYIIYCFVNTQVIKNTIKLYH